MLCPDQDLAEAVAHSPVAIRPSRTAPAGSVNDSQVSGMEPCTEAPWPGSDCQRTEPPIAPSRSAMFM
jgi:hypothetical protein